MSAPGPANEERLAVLQSVKAGLEEQVHRLNEDSKQVGVAGRHNITRGVELGVRAKGRPRRMQRVSEGEA